MGRAGKHLFVLTSDYFDFIGNSEIHNLCVYDDNIAGERHPKHGCIAYSAICNTIFATRWW